MSEHYDADISYRNCPYCERKMQKGILKGDGRSATKFIADGQKYHFGDLISGRGRIDTTYSWGSFSIEAWYCDDCKKMILDTDVQK